MNDILSCGQKERSRNSSVLDQVHESQEKLDCLDYLIYSMKNNKKKGK